MSPRVLVTGAGGMLGRDLVPHLSAGHDVLALDVVALPPPEPGTAWAPRETGSLDVTDLEEVRARVRDARPAVIHHLAAFTDVDGAEAREADAAAVNEEGSANVAIAAAEAGAAMVLPSTDYVFDGRDGPYDEDAPTAPLGAYGRTKLAGEREALARHPGGVRVARTAWLYGAGGRNFVDTMRRLGAERDRVDVVDDQEGSPTWTVDLAPALAALAALAPGVYHTAGGGTVTWAGLAEAVFADAGLDCRVRAISTAELGRPAPRPARSGLLSTRPGAPRLRPWRAALRAYLSSIALAAR